MPIAASQTDPSAIPLPSAQVAFIDDLAGSTMASQKIPGLSLAIVVSTHTIIARPYGFADKKLRVPVTTHTTFNLASVSKPITATAIMQIVENGNLNLETPITELVPAFPRKPWPITIRHLLSHQSGIRHYRNFEIYEINSQLTLEQGLARFSNDPLINKPGDAVEYSSYGFNLLGRALELKSGQLFESYVQNHIFNLSGMTTAHIASNLVTTSTTARGYSVIGNDIVEVPQFSTRYKAPSGGIACSARDLARFSIAYMDNSLLRPETCALMETPQTLNNGTTTSRGLGWKLDKWHHHQAILHSGAQPGYSTFLYIIPEKGFSVAILANLSEANLYPIVRTIRNNLLNEPEP